MGVEVNIWRARIGAFASVQRKKSATFTTVPNKKSVCASAQFELGLIIAILLVIAGVEMNPGPFTMGELKQIVDALQPTLTESNRQQTEVLQRELWDVKAMVNDYKERCDSQYKEMKDEMQALRDTNQELQDKVNMQESIPRKNNILIHGVAEGEHEDTVALVTDICTTLNVQTGQGTITEAIRIGRNKGKRPILCKLNAYAKKKEIMDKNRARGQNQFSIYHDMSKLDRDYKKLLKPYRDYAIQHQYKAHIRGTKLIINGEAWTLDELRERFDDQLPDRADGRENVISGGAEESVKSPQKNADARKNVNHIPASNSQQTPGARQVVTVHHKTQHPTETDDWPLPGPSSTHDTEHMDYDGVSDRTTKRSYSKAVQSPPTTRKKSVDLVKDITKRFDAIAGKAAEKSPPKRGKMANTE
jgi:hypothetical protein